jgi:uncharacterized membrane protein (UPF0127 family)
MIRLAGAIPREFNQQVVIDGKQFVCWIANNHTTRALGLMGCKLKAKQACLLDFGEEVEFGLWMKNCLHPLVALFIDSNGKIVSSSYMDPQNPYLTHRPSVPCRYALEILPEEADGILIGSQVYVQE